MILWFCVLFLSLQIVCLEQYETIQFKDEVKVEGFAFSEDEKIMVVNQNYYFSIGNIVNLPNRLYKKGEEGFKLFEKNSYSAVNQNSFITSLMSMGRLQVNNRGTVYITVHNDKVIRVYQIKDSMSVEIQKLNFGSEQPYLAQLSWDGNYLIVKLPSSGTKIFKWIGDKFE